MATRSLCFLHGVAVMLRIGGLIWRENSFPCFLLKYSIFLSLCLFAAIVVHADGSFSIRFSGNLDSQAKNRMTVREIESVGTVSFDVFNPYEKKSQRYTGIWLDRLVESIAAPGTRVVRMTAIDEYQSEFTREEWQTQRILLATRVDGDYIGFDRKGPMRIVYVGFDEHEPHYKDTLSKWMWMITRIEFE